jgi:brefeldin A-inhibited guanine nucleotide-exchange protein
MSQTNPSHSLQLQEVHAVLDAAIEGLKKFAHDEWPRKAEKDDFIASSETDLTDNTSNTGVSNEESVVTIDPTLSNSQQTTFDDPQTRENVHPAVETCLEAFIAILLHPAKLAVPRDMALECISLLISHRYVSGRAGGSDDISGSGSRAAEVAAQRNERPPPPSLVHRLLESVAKVSESNVESTQAALIKTMKTIMTSPKCGVHETSMLLALRSTFHVYLVAKSAMVKDTARSAMLDILRSVIGRMEAFHAVQKSKENSNNNNKNDEITKTHVDPNDDPIKKPFASQYHADCYTLFRALCKMSSKELADEKDDKADYLPAAFSFFNMGKQEDSPMMFESKILALELILASIELSGEAFRLDERFVYLVQQYLCVSLLRNCMSNNTQVAFLSQKVFLVLVRIR